MKKHSMPPRPFVSHNSGFVVLLSVLIVSTIATAIVVSMLLLGIGFTRTSFTVEQSVQARNLANACAEEALQQISDSTPFTGTGSLSLGNGTCAYEVLDEGGQSRVIEASGTIDAAVRRVRVDVDSINPSIVINKWEEVDSF